MDLTGSYTILAQRSDVWNALNDPNILRECIPGCETLSMLSETESAATVVAKIGPLKARFTGRVELSEIDPNNGYRIQGEGSGGSRLCQGRCACPSPRRWRQHCADL
jgi:carbon monoxide dehydrogenase subunit G